MFCARVTVMTLKLGSCGCIALVEHATKEKKHAENPVDAEWLSGRMPDSRAREHRHESSYGLHIGAVDGDSLWRCYAMTTQTHCTCYFVINRDFDFFIAPLFTQYQIENNVECL